MTLIANWRAVLKHAASVRLFAIAILFCGLDAATPYLYGVLPIPDGLFAWFAMLASMAGIVARIVVQRVLTGATTEPGEKTR